MQIVPTEMPPTPDKTEGGQLMPADYKMPVIDIDPARCHAQKKVDFSDESEILKYVRPHRWLSLDIGGVRLLRFASLSLSRLQATDLSRLGASIESVACNLQLDAAIECVACNL